jgi:hypothetical protein
MSDHTNGNAISNLAPPTVRATLPAQLQSRREEKSKSSPAVKKIRKNPRIDPTRHEAH